MPIQCEYYALEGLSQLLRNVKLVSTNLNATLEVTTIVLTMFDARTRLSGRRGQRGPGALRRAGLPDGHPADGPALGGAFVRPAHHGVRSGLAGRSGLPRAGQGGEQWRAAADSVRASSALIPSEATGEADSAAQGGADLAHPAEPVPAPDPLRRGAHGLPGGVDPRGGRAPAGARARARGRGGQLRADRRRAALAGRPRGPGSRPSRRWCRTADDVASLEQAMVENLHREDLNALEEAAAYQQLIEEFGLTHEQVATRVGKGRATVTNTLRLLQLPPGSSGRWPSGPSRPATPGRCSAPRTGRSRRAGRAIVARRADGAGRRGRGRDGGPSCGSSRSRAGGRRVGYRRPEPQGTTERGPERATPARSCPSRGCSSSRSCSRPTSTPG